MTFYSTEYWLRGKPRSSYRKLAHHKKKILSDVDVCRRDWRLKKGFKRSRMRHYTFHFRCYPHQSKRWYKQNSNGKHRAWENNEISHERWDNLTMDYTIITHDTWDIF